MRREEIFDAWAPEGALWSDWVKPISFAQIPEAWSRWSEPYESIREDVSWLAIPARPTAIVVDVAGEMAVAIGVALAHRGFRPVPLFNAVTVGEVESQRSLTMPSAALGACLNMWPILAALAAAAPALRALRLPFDAPPAFLLDSRRRIGERPPVPGLLDNRWMCFPADFPSALRLQEAGIREAILIADLASAPAADLSHVLCRWQDSGIHILRALISAPGPAQGIHVAVPSRFRVAWYSFLASLGLRQSPLGGFGGRVPYESGGAG